jgi:galactose oxidase-like protein/Kelch motif protein
LLRHERNVGFITLALVATLLLVNTPAFARGWAAPPPPAAVGQWSAPIDIGIVGIHASLLHTGKVLLWYYPSVVGANSPAVVFDPNTNIATRNDITSSADFFCSGSTILSDGKVMIIGGLNGIPPSPDYGIASVEFFNPITSTWSAGTAMANARWYPTALSMPDGTVYAVSGTDASGTKLVLPMEVYRPFSGTWQTMPTKANIAPTAQTYPRLTVLTTGKVLMSGTGAFTRLFDPVAKTWSTLGTMNYGSRIYGGVVLLPGLQKILTAGGHATVSGPATNTAEILDLSQPTPTWAYTGSMTNPRYNFGLTLLADGTVLAVGGNQVSKYSNPVEAAELYDPATGTWTVMASQTARRGYHSTSLLLPDGRVLSAGSDDFVAPDLSQTVEIYSPPYLFQGARPTITSAPTSVKYNAAFTITTPDAANITRVALIRPGSVTHADDFDQRYVDLAFTTGAGVVNATAPPSGNYAPPGYYMLVIVNSSGVPSVMPFVRVSN